MTQDEERFKGLTPEMVAAIKAVEEKEHITCQSQAREQADTCPFCGENPRVRSQIGFDSGVVITCQSEECEVRPAVFLRAPSMNWDEKGHSFRSMPELVWQKALDVWNKRF